MRRSGDAVQTSPHRYLYDLWKHLLRRCTNPQDRQWHNYGGRGIQVHPAWLDDYAAFKAYILSELGERPSSDGPRSKWSLDRIDNDGNYEPGNLRWSMARTQLLNRRMAGQDHNIMRSGSGRGDSWGVQRYGLTREQALAYRDAGEATLRPC